MTPTQSTNVAIKPSANQLTLQTRLTKAFDLTMNLGPHGVRLFDQRPIINGAFIKQGSGYRGANFRNLFQRTILPVVPTNPAAGCTYFDVSLDLDCGLTPYCFLRSLLVRKLPVWAKHGRLGYRFITDTIDDAPLIKATCVRIVTKQGSEAGLHGEIISDWFCYNSILEFSNLATVAETMDQLLDFAVSRPGKTVARYQPIDKTKDQLIPNSEFKLIALPQ
jgi:hypothetical protein